MAANELGGTRRSLSRALAFAALFSWASPAAAGPRPLWSFHAGAPLSGPPTIGADGTIAVGTVDGYLHALGPDGAFRYSYTVEGRVVASPAVLSDGLVLVASDKSRLYAIKPDGSLAWWRMVAGGVASPLARDTQDRVWMRTGSGTAIAMSRRGGIVGFAKIGRAMTLGPTPLLDGGVVVGNPTGELGLIGEYGRFRRGFFEGPRGFWALASGFLALGSKNLERLASDLDVTWMRIDVAAVFCRWPIVTLEGGEIRWIDNGGSVTAHVADEGGLSTPSACTTSSLFAVDERGRVVQLRPSGERLRLEAGDGTLIGLDASLPGALLLAYRDGRLVALKVAP